MRRFLLIVVLCGPAPAVTIGMDPHPYGPAHPSANITVTGQCNLHQWTVGTPLVYSTDSPFCDDLIETHTYGWGDIGPYGFSVAGNGAFEGGPYLVTGEVEVRVSMSLDVVVLGGVGPGLLQVYTTYSTGHGGMLGPSGFSIDSTFGTNAGQAAMIAYPFVFGETITYWIDTYLLMTARSPSSYAGYGFLGGASIQGITDAEGNEVSGARIVEAEGGAGGGQDGVSEIPEPSAGLLCGFGVLAVAVLKMRRTTRGKPRREPAVTG